MLPTPSSPLPIGRRFLPRGVGKSLLHARIDRYGRHCIRCRLTVLAAGGAAGALESRMMPVAAGKICKKKEEQQPSLCSYPASLHYARLLWGRQTDFGKAILVKLGLPVNSDYPDAADEMIDPCGGGRLK